MPQSFQTESSWSLHVITYMFDGRIPCAERVIVSSKADEKEVLHLFCKSRAFID